jgi:hypothetical protein
MPDRGGINEQDGVELEPSGVMTVAYWNSAV